MLPTGPQQYLVLPKLAFLSIQPPQCSACREKYHDDQAGGKGVAWRHVSVALEIYSKRVCLKMLDT